MLMYIKCCIFVICIANITSTNYALDETKLVIIIMSQREGYHAAAALKLRDDIQEQAKGLDPGILSLRVVLTLELDLNGTWSVGPMLPYIASYHSSMDWYFFCEEYTVVKLNLLLQLLSSLNAEQEVWLGHALYDHEPTIIHHFADHTKRFKYPNTASGFIISKPLMKSLSKRYANGEKPDGEFSIDAAHEFATFVWNAGKGKRMIHAPELCVISGDNCATYPHHVYPCGQSVPMEKIYVAIKTCSKFHKERLPVIMKTWTKYAVNIGLYSDKIDENLPGAIVTPNTTRGHCAKTYFILKHSVNILKNENIDWLVITDDDTILSLGRLLRVLSCYNSGNFVALGERYGFRLWENNGYDYLTGGAGVVLSATLVEKLIQSHLCHCPSSSTPDDMYLFGVCLNRVGVRPTHSPLFHQARPADYPVAYLASQEPISFHKFWQLNPEQVYAQWFAEADSKLSRSVRHMGEL